MSQFSSESNFCEIEILVINDGSTRSKNSQKIIEDFQNKFPQKNKNFCKGKRRFKCAGYRIRQSNGEFLAFVDSDDYVSATMMEEMYGLAKKHEAEIVICNLQKVDENGIVTQKLTQIPNLPEKIDLEKHFSVFSDVSYFACNKIFKRELFDGKKFRKFTLKI
ncbi:MAG: glycosyltransferase family 2 protein [Cloacibacterium normanense]